ncbi:hypothetical protein [Brachybacterium sp. GPGPB12]|uniref:hypothetical protein n=1 Tax=Brachybacterium sp. GPGPB12 TaxID=3023517 RepID=UPI0031343C10
MESTGYYTFEIAPGVVGIALDSTNRAGFTQGSLGHAQYRWLEETLEEGSSRYYDGIGRLQRTQSGDTYFVVFSHHTPDTMNNLLLEPGVREPRHAGWDVENLLGRFPNVLAWVNGHTHTNTIAAARRRRRRAPLLEDHHRLARGLPAQQARVLEVVDNRDGTLSLLSTLIEAKAPYQGEGLASLYRELSFNDLHAERAQEGEGKDRNVEPLLATPGH